MIIQVNSRNMPVLECFSSETRVKMIELLSDRPMNIKELAEALGLSSAIVTKHIQKLEEAGLVGSESLSGTRGRTKVCFLVPDTVTLLIKAPPQPERNRYTVSIPVGQYADFRIRPTCGLASEAGIIGIVDDPRYFSDPQHVKANHLWFGSGYLEYRIPNFLVGRQTLHSVSFSLEMCSEAPGYNENWPSDISFHLNDIPLGTWTCPGDFGASRGVHTPEWWNLGTQYGLLKIVSVREDGTYLDGVRLSDVRIADLGVVQGQELRLRLSCEEQTYGGGISLFGKHFGNYDQDIEVTLSYKP